MSTLRSKCRNVGVFFPNCKQLDSISKPLIFEKFHYALTKTKMSKHRRQCIFSESVLPVFYKKQSLILGDRCFEERREGRFLFLSPNPCHPMIKVYEV